MMKEEWLLRGAVVPVDVETTATLVAEIKRLIDVVGGLVLKQGPDYERGFVDGMQKQMQSSVDKAVNRMAQPEQDAVQRLSALVRAQQITIDKLEAQPDPYAKGYADAMNWKVQNHLEHLPVAQPEQEPVAFPRQAGDSTWTVDTAFIWRVKHTIDPDTPHDFIPSEEQIETVLLALERIPSGIYTTPPQRGPLTDEEINDIAKNYALNNPTTPLHFARAIEAAHGIKENT